LWFRRHLMELGKIEMVQELPRYAFSQVEGPVFLLSFVKGEYTSNILLTDLSLTRTVCLEVSDKSSGDCRLDISYRAARVEQTRRICRSEVEWVPLCSVAEVIRGTLQSPLGKRFGMHSTDRRDGFWWGHERQLIQATSKVSCVRSGDLLLQRVGRSCSKSLGLVVNGIGVECSDCVFIIRPYGMVSDVRLLLLARAVLALPETQAVLEKGMGAKYLTLRAVLGLRIPLLDDRNLPFVFSQYLNAVSQRDRVLMEALERELGDVLNTAMSPGGSIRISPDTRSLSLDPE